MPAPKSSSHVSATDVASGRQQEMFPSTGILEEQKKLNERARNRLTEIRELKKQALAPLEEEERQLLALLGQVGKVDRRQSTSAVRSGLRNYIRDALKASGQKMRMSEIAHGVEKLGYQPQPGGTLKAVDQALRAMKKKGEVVHFEVEKLWQWSEAAVRPEPAAKKPRGKKKG